MTSAGQRVGEREMTPAILKSGQEFVQAGMELANGDQLPATAPGS